jgi:SP family sugar:H+ symporter-like MFS transporter
VLNSINFFSTFITVVTIDKFGRVKLMVYGGMVMCFALTANAILSSLDQTETVGYCVLGFAALFIVGFAVSWGPVVWVSCAEIFPLRTRAKGTGMTTMTNWVFTTLVGAIFPRASSASLSGCFAFFAVFIALGTMTVYLFQPETAGLSILEIDEAFKKQKPSFKRKIW